ncbi:MAG: hypothetical protein ACI8ZF_000457 [Candidatus Midichloriaceae bacterium]|jgi:hypothetical protein
MSLYRSKLVKYASILLILFFVYKKYSENKNSPRINKIDHQSLSSTPNPDSKYTIKIDENKKYDEYSAVEKLVYNSVKEKLPPSVRDKVEKQDYKKPNK